MTELEDVTPERAINLYEWLRSQAALCGEAGLPVAGVPEPDGVGHRAFTEPLRRGLAADIFDLVLWKHDLFQAATSISGAITEGDVATRDQLEMILPQVWINFGHNYLEVPMGSGKTVEAFDIGWAIWPDGAIDPEPQVTDHGQVPLGLAVRLLVEQETKQWIISPCGVAQEADPVCDDWPRILAALEFMNQPIAVVRELVPPRPVRRRALREKRTLKTLHAVLLRREYEETKSEARQRGVEWACQWLVGTHYRRQYMPSTGGHARRLISAYVKGPKGKPLKPPTRMVKIVRR